MTDSYEPSTPTSPSTGTTLSTVSINLLFLHTFFITICLLLLLFSNSIVPAVAQDILSVLSFPTTIVFAIVMHHHMPEESTHLLVYFVFTVSAVCSLVYSFIPLEKLFFNEDHPVLSSVAQWLALPVGLLVYAFVDIVYYGVANYSGKDLGIYGSVHSWSCETCKGFGKGASEVFLDACRGSAEYVVTKLRRPTDGIISTGSQEPLIGRERREKEASPPPPYPHKMVTNEDDWYRKAEDSAV